MEKFAVYKHQFELPSGTIARRQLIVVKHDDGTMTFTDLGKYIRGKKTVKTPANDGNSQFYFIVEMLNYVFQKHRIKKLNDLTIDMVKEFLQTYAQGTLNEDDTQKTQETVNMCVSSVLNFLSNYAEDNKATFKLEDLYRTELYKTSYNEIATRKVPVFDVIADVREKTIHRDIPNKIFSLLLNHIAENHIELLGLVMLQAFAGLRPAEACNVRREDSPLGAGMMFNITDGKVTKIRIDLRKELNLRSDNIRVGNIKKERVADVPVIFIESFMQAYKKYLAYLEKQPCEEEYKPFTLNRSGKALTYNSYYKTFTSIIENEFAPMCFKSKDSDVVEYGLILMENKLSPHAFRHWYSVQLTLAGYTASELMHARGDKSIGSALTYIQNKGELEKIHSKVTNGIFDYFQWAGEKKHES